MTLAFKRAERSQSKLKLGIQGPSGSGKTLGALALARTLAAGAPIAVIDTENGSASLYADRYTFDVLNLEPPYTSERYLEALRAAVDAGYGAVVVDSLSQQWAGAGGILARKEMVDARGGNSFTNWGPFTKEHEAFKAALLALPTHVIATLRTKQDYVMETDSRGKQMPKKVGLAAIQREGMEYELSIMFELQMDHRASTSKDRTGLFDGQLVDLCDATTGKRLMAWLASGKPLAEGEQRLPLSTAVLSATHSPTSTGQVDHPATTSSAESEMTLEQAREIPLMGKPENWGGHGGKRLGTLSRDLLESARMWFEEKAQEDAAKGKPVRADRAEQIEAITLILEDLDSVQASLPLDVPGEAPASNQVVMPPPGKLEDALPLPTPHTTPNATPNGKKGGGKQPVSIGAENGPF